MTLFSSLYTVRYTEVSLRVLTILIISTIIGCATKLGDDNVSSSSLTDAEQEFIAALSENGFNPIDITVNSDLQVDDQVIATIVEASGQTFDQPDIGILALSRTAELTAMIRYRAYVSTTY